MGFLDFISKGRELVAVNAVASPWSVDPSPLNLITTDLLPALFPSVDIPLDRSKAMTIPVVARIRNLLVGLIAPLPLIALRDAEKLADQPTFLYRSDSAVSPYERMAWTVDSILFYGCALWRTYRGAGGQLLDAQWIPQHMWTITDGKILVDEQEVDENDVLLFNSPFEGLLTVGQRTLRGAIDLEESWTSRVKNPIPLVELSLEDDSNLDQDEVDAYVKAWAAKHKSTDAAVGMTPAGMKLIDHGAASPDLFIQARNAIRTDIANILNIPVSLVDGTSGTGSLTYKTTTGEVDRFRGESLPFWVDPIQQALSQDKVVPRGTRVRFDLSELEQSPTPTGAVVPD